MIPSVLSPSHRRLVVLFAMAAAVMNQVDTTIANVALPHMQGSTSASREQITWVLTSYIVAAAICTPLTGWLATRFGRKRLMLASIVGFTATSGLCGIAGSLTQLILFRVLQGVFGSALVPMSQATMLDIFPPEEHGKAMAVFALAAIMGPLAGPLLGGWLTEAYSWHWVFLINLPIGVASFIGLSRFMPEAPPQKAQSFDLAGFALLALAIGAFQLMLDRGQMLDWFSSTEICIEAALSAAALYMLVVHVSTARHPFFSLGLFADRNFVICTAIGFFLGIMVFSVLALLPALLSDLMGHPIIAVGLVMAPRGIGTMIATLAAGQLSGRVDPRILVAGGLLTAGVSAWLLSGMSLAADDWPVISSGVLQGIGASLIFVPLSAMSFATLPARLRNEGAALGSLIRNLGGSTGIALVQALTIRNAAIVQSRLTEGVRPDSPVLQMALPDFDFTSVRALAAIEGEVVRQATMVAYVDTFWILFVIAVLACPLVLLLRGGPRSN